MLTFSESNGAIKKVTDGLTSLLTAWTKWRNRNQGGDAAIQTYEMAEEEVAKYGKQYIEGDRAAGMSDSAIKKNAEAEKAAIEEEIVAMKEVLELWEEAESKTISGKAKDEVIPKVREVFGDIKGGNWTEQMRKTIASKQDNIAISDYIISALTAPSATAAPSDSGGGVGGEGAKSKSRLATLKAQYEEQEKAQIASLDRMAMNEADYEAQVYKIRRETLQKIADLYQDETAEKARANAAISQLDIQYQGTQMRLANKGNTSKKKATEEYTGIGEFSQKAIDARMSHAKKIMDSSEIGSDRYLYEADKIVDLTTLQNLMSEATKRGLTIDPEFIKEQLGQIDVGLGVSDSTWQTLVDSLNEQIDAANDELPSIKLNIETGAVEQLDKEVTKTIDHVGGAAQAFSALGNAMSQIDDPGAKVAGMIAEAIGSVASGYGAATAQAATMGPWAWIAFAVTGLATMISTIAAIKSATAGSYASGGIIPGNSFSGDNQRGILPSGEMIGINAGELILNRAQQDSVAAQLQGGAAQTVNVQGMISGTNLILAIQNQQMQNGVSVANLIKAH